MPWPGFPYRNYYRLLPQESTSDIDVMGIARPASRGTLDKVGKAGKLEAAAGFEPAYNGFADHCLSHLATPP